MIPRVSLRQALSDPALLGHVFDGDGWAPSPWPILLIAAMGEALTDEERAVFAQLTGREREPGHRVAEFVAVKGRRAGGSYAVGKAVIPYLAGLCQHPVLARGERGVLLCVAADQRQADVILDYAEAAFTDSPVLSQLIEQRTARELRLLNGIDIEVRAADFRRLRGLTFIGVIADEVAYWMNENSANPDDEILNGAVRPGLATTAGPLFMISSPYARKGELWRAYRRHFGPTGDPLTLVAQGSSRTFNPTLPQSVIDRAYEHDPTSAQAEYGAQFRSDIESFVVREVVEACVPLGLYERPPQPGLHYEGFVDPSGGSSDSMALAIAHREADSYLLDCVREVTPPFSPEVVVAELAAVCKSYSVYKIIGDRYAGLWPVEQFKKHGIKYEQSAKPKSDLYRDLLPLLNSRCVELLDSQRLISQLTSLERRTARGGRDSIDHKPGAHDDVANAVAGALLCAQQRRKARMLYSTYSDYADGVVHPLYEVTRDSLIELDRATGQPLARRGTAQFPRLRLSVVKVSEQDAPAPRGPY